MATSSVITDAQQRVRYGKRQGQECLLLWKTSLASAIEDKDWIGSNAADLASLVLEAVRTYSDHKCERAVLSFAQTAAARSDAFVKALAAGIVKQSAGLSTGKLSKHEQYGLLVLARVAVQKLDPAAAKKAVAKLVELQGALADALISGDVQWKVLSRQLRGEAKQQPAVTGDMLDVAKAPAPTVPPGAPHVLARTMLECSQTAAAEQQASTKQELLTMFCDKVMNGREKVTPAVAACYGKLFSSLTADDFNSKVMPAVTRSLRRTADVAMTALSALLAGCSLDISSHAGELTTILIQQLRSKEAIRPLAVSTLQQVATRTEDAQALSQLVGMVKGVLDGTAEGKIKVVGERVALTQALTALASSPCTGTVYNSLVDTVAAFTASAAKDEANDEARGVLLAATSAWLTRAPAGASCLPSVLTVLCNMIKEAKDVPRKQALRTAAQVMTANAALREGCMPILEPAAKVVVEALAKPALRLEGVLALTAAVHVAASSADADSVLSKAGVWSGAFKPDSSLLSLAGAAKLPAADVPYLVQLAECVLMHHATSLAATPGAQDLVCRLLAALSVHHSAEVRRAAGAALGRVAAAPRMLRPLALALAACGSSQTAVTPLAVAPDASGEDAVLQRGTLALRLSIALRALLPKPRDNPPDAAELCALLMASHQPALTEVLPAKASAALWASLVRHLPGLSKALPGMAAAVTQTLMGPEGVGSSSAAEVSAAQASLAACMALSPSAMMPHVLDGLSNLLDRTAHDALTVAELDIYETPRGMLASERVPEGVYVAQVVENKNVRKARGRFKTNGRAFGGDDDDEDDEPALPQRPAPFPAARQLSNGAAAGRGVAAAGGRGPAPGKKDAAARQAEWRQSKLQEEEQIRVRVEGVAARLALGSDTLCAVVAGNPRAASLRLEQLQQLVMPLLASHIAGAAAFRAVKGLSGCLPAPLNLQALSTAASLRLVTLAQAGDQGIRYQDIPSAAQVADVVHALKKVTGERRPLPAQAYRFVFPILQAVLSSGVHTPLHDEALALVALHCAPGMDVPRAASLGMLQHLLGVIPAYRERVAPLLKQLASGCSNETEVIAAAGGVLHAASAVRAASLASLQEVPGLTQPPGLSSASAELVCLLHLACHDVVEENAQLAKHIWEQAGCSIPADYVEHLVAHVTQCPGEVQQAAAAALSSAAKAHAGSISDALTAVIEAYQEGDVLGRRGCATALKALAGDLGDAEVTTALDFLIGSGLADMNDKVREEMVAAGTAVVDIHGAKHAPRLLPLFESYLDDSKRTKSGHEEAHYDLVREGVVVFLGTLARHLPPQDPKRESVVDTLVTVLSTPSEAVQRAVSNCLSPLMAPLAAKKEAIDQLVARLLSNLTKGKTYGDRRGAAFGLAGLVKGLGIMSMKNAGIMDALKAAVEDKKDPAAREGALLAFECLSDKLGKLFEPYIIYILPLLLNCFGDAIPQVRAATEDAARMIMGQLTASGVKLVLPSLLKGLEDKAWRTKQGSVQLLGSMAYCAPKQLGSCLPTIVPRLSEVLSDPHPKVQAAANESLKEIGSVIRNPEVSALVPSLMAAIADPNSATRPALDVLLETVFVNTIDAASLALIVPVIHRGLRDRTGDTKKRAARIAGNLASLVNDPKDMVPYVPLLRPELQKALVDPLPEVRAFAARAIGSLLQGMGTQQFGDLVPWLTATLRSEGSSVERSGAAQGLAEVLAVLGPNHLEALLPELLAGCSDRTSPSAREGHLVLLQYLPITLEATFAKYLDKVLPSVLDGLSDESEGVRDAALGAGRILVDHYANTALNYLLPAIEDGIFADNWRIRHSSVKLLGKLLFKVAGTSGNIVLDGGSDDEGAAEDSYNEAIIHALGMDKRNEVLSRLYMCRSDPQYPVRTEALHVWKSVVPNTPKTLGQVLPALMQQIIDSLACDIEDRQVMAGRCLGELVRKMGERVLSRIIPILVAGVKSEHVSTRQGVCLGMKEVLENIGRQQMADHLADVLPAIQAALCDEDVGVREAAGAAFSIMFRGGAGSAVDSVVPGMLEGLSNPAKYGESVEGLRVILGVRPQMFSSVLPKLMKTPLQLHALNALRELASVASPVLHHHIKSVLSPLMVLANKPDGGPKEAAAAEALAAVAAAVPDDAVHLLVAEMRGSLENAARKRATAHLIAGYAASRKNNAEALLEHVPQLLHALISLFSDDDPEVVSACWKAVEALAALIPKDDAASYVNCVTDAIRDAKETERRKRTGKALLVAGLCLPKALSPLLPIFLQGVLQGASTEVRQQAAQGLGEMVVVTSEEALKPYVVQITGPLIRIVGDRFPASVKAAILVTLGALIVKAGVGLKPFVPQLQTTFLKCLADPDGDVHNQAATNLGELSRMSPRVEQLASELATLARTADAEVRISYLTALRGLLVNSGDRLGAAILSSVGDSLRDMAKTVAGSNQQQHVLAGCLGAHAKHAAEEHIRATLNWGPLNAAGSAADRPLHAYVLATVVRYAGSKLSEAGLVQPMMDAATRLARDPEVSIKVAAGRAAARLAVVQPSVLPAACNVLGGLMGLDQNSEVQRQALLAVRRMAAGVTAAGAGDALEAQFSTIIPVMCAIASSTAGPIKFTSELSLARVLQLEGGVSELAQRYLASGPGSTVRTTLTDPFMRRVSKLSEEEELFADEEY